MMINFNLICKSKHWPARVRKIDLIVKKILIFQKDLNFNKYLNYECNLILSDNKLLKKMNFKFRKKKYSTDVLTFVNEIINKNDKKLKICDIFLSAEILKKDAKKNQTKFYDHLTHILVHSFLHINGYMHVKIKDFKIMQNKEIKILNQLKIENPYL